MNGPGSDDDVKTAHTAVFRALRVLAAIRTDAAKQYIAHKRAAKAAARANRAAPDPWLFEPRETCSINFDQPDTVLWNALDTCKTHWKGVKKRVGYETLHSLDVAAAFIGKILEINDAVARAGDGSRVRAAGHVLTAQIDLKAAASPVELVIFTLDAATVTTPIFTAARSVICLSGSLNNVDYFTSLVGLTDYTTLSTDHCVDRRRNMVVHCINKAGYDGSFANRTLNPAAYLRNLCE